MTIVLRTQRKQERIEGRMPTIEWRDIIGRVYREQIPAGTKWCWFLPIMGASPNSGNADTLDHAKV